jgi:hypothetical protein
MNILVKALYTITIKYFVSFIRKVTIDEIMSYEPVDASANVPNMKMLTTFR